MNEAFCFEQVEFALQKVDQKVNAMKDDFTQKLDKLSIELKNEIKSIIDSSKPILNDVNTIESLFYIAKSSVDSKLSESNISHLAEILHAIDDLLSKYQQNENSDEDKIQLYIKELIKKTIPSSAMEAFNNLKDIEKYVEKLVVAKLEKELQKLKDKFKSKPMIHF